MKRLLALLLLGVSSVALALGVGDPAPLPNLIDSFGKPVKLEAFKGKWIVMYFYPKAGTPGCTAQNIEYTKLAVDFKAANAVAIGVSNDTSAAQCEFIKQHDLKVPQIPDEKANLARIFDVNGGFFGYSRDTIIISPAAKIAQVRRNVNPIQDARQSLEFIRAQK